MLCHRPPALVTDAAGEGGGGMGAVRGRGYELEALLRYGYTERSQRHPSTAGSRLTQHALTELT